MVFKITVKTLDSLNYEFEVAEDLTVIQFKEHIQGTVNVASAEQRLIFCGRVLQNDSKLAEFDCNGKVIHLVRRPPPTHLDNERPDRRTTTEPRDQREVPYLEGTFTITATTIDTTSPSNRLQATATIVIAQADPNQPGHQIPVTIPLPVTTRNQSQPESESRDGQQQQSQQQPLQQQPSRSDGQQQKSTSMLLAHPEWIPYIEQDANRMAEHRHRYFRFSDAYLSFIPKKRRCGLAATPERVPVLHPLSSRAIAEILRRSILSSNLPRLNLDNILESLASDRDLQGAYDEFIKEAVKDRLKFDSDFDPTKYNFTKSYFD